MTRGLSPENKAKMDAFADALAETGNLQEAARICGITIAAAEMHLHRIRKKLGWQAQ